MQSAWAPQDGPQAEAIAATWCEELFFGGARGGGKSDFLLGDFLQDVQTYGEHWRGILFRKSHPELQEIVERGKQLFLPTGAIWYEQKREFRWPNGAFLRMRHIDSDGDADSYQGHQYTWIGWDELPIWKSLYSYFKLKACLRYAAADVPTKRIRSAGNPGGPGHQAVKAYFIDHAVMGYVPRTDTNTGHRVMFVPSRVQDNRILLDRDPGYIGRLKGVGSPELVRAWLEGDWNVVTGAYFPEFGLRHIIQPIALPGAWLRFRSIDWGSAKPFSVGWWAVSDGTLPQFPAGALIRYREWYGSSEPNVGLKMTAAEVAKGIRSREIEGTAYSVGDPAMFQEDGGPSIAEEFSKQGVYLQPADNSRIAGWNELRGRLKGVDDKPLIYVFSTCRDTIRTLPAIQHDEKRPEDVDSDGEDHAPDEIRYACMSRPWFRKQVEKQKERQGLTLNTLFEEHQRSLDY